MRICLLIRLGALLPVHFLVAGFRSLDVIAFMLFLEYETVMSDGRNDLNLELGHTHVVEVGLRKI